MAKMPMSIVTQLAYWAWAEHKMETLPEERNFRPHWEKSCLVDAFLRGWPLPYEDKKLNEARIHWESWRPLALLALDNSLKKIGLALSDISVENTVFRVLNSDEQQMTLGVFHILDSHHDAIPVYKNQTTIFSSAFGNREAILMPAKTAQEQAIEIMTNKVLNTRSLIPTDLNKALCLDTGKALDLMLNCLCRPFEKPDLQDDIQCVKKEAAEKINPLTLFQQKEKYPESATELNGYNLQKNMGTRVEKWMHRRIFSPGNSI